MSTVYANEAHSFGVQTIALGGAVLVSASYGDALKMWDTLAACSFFKCKKNTRGDNSTNQD